MAQATTNGNIPGQSICIPASPPVDVAEFVPLLDHALFQKLKHRKQLGVNFLVFPGAVHTRFEHSLGVLGLTQRLCRIHRIEGQARRHLCAYALVHDVGHGPFSHQIEPILRGSHKTRGVQCLEAMGDTLRECDLDPAALTAMLAGKDQLGLFVSDRNLGTDKLDYLVRDALHIGFVGAPDIERVQFYTLLEDGDLAIEEKFTEDIKRVQKFYSYQHQHGYLNKTAMAIQRVFQRAVQEELAEGRGPASALWDMTDNELTGWLQQGRSARGRRLVARLDDRSFHRSVVVIKPEGYGFVERCSDKGLAVREWPVEKFRLFSRAFSDCRRVMDLEDRLAAALGFEPGDLLLAAMPYFEKLVPKDVRICSARGGAGFWLFEKDLDHLQSLKGDYLRTSAIRVVTPPSERDRARRRADGIIEFLDAALATG